MWLSRSGSVISPTHQFSIRPDAPTRGRRNEPGCEGRRVGGGVGTGGMWGAGRDHSCKILHPGLVALQASGKSGLPGNSDAPIPQCGSWPPVGGASRK